MKISYSKITAIAAVFLLVSGAVQAARLDTATYQIKVSPSKFIWGDYGAQFETAISSHLAFNGGLGVTCSMLLNEVHRFRYSTGKQLPGVSGQASIRWYFVRSAANRGFSMEFMYRYQRFHARQPIDANSSSILSQSSELADKLQISANMHFSLNFAYQIVSGGNWVFTPYVGFGFLDNTQFYTYEVEESIIDANSGTMSHEITHQRNKISQLWPSFKAGVEIGILRFKK